MKVYESRETGRFMPLLPIYARLDGRGFSRFMKGMDRPFDARMQQCMIDTTIFLVQESHALIGYTQSDEISLVWNSDDYSSQVFFDGKKQKIVSVLASMATMIFNRRIQELLPEWYSKCPTFDCRAFSLPSKIEAANAFLWREQDATKNAVSMAARSMFSHAELMNKGRSDMNEMMWKKGINFNDFPASFKRGTFVRRENFEVPISDLEIPDEIKITMDKDTVTRSRVVPVEMPSFGTVKNRVDVIFSGAYPETEIT